MLMHVLVVVLPLVVVVVVPQPVLPLVVVVVVPQPVLPLVLVCVGGGGEGDGGGKRWSEEQCEPMCPPQPETGDSFALLVHQFPEFHVSNQPASW